MSDETNNAERDMHISNDIDGIDAVRVESLRRTSRDESECNPS